VEDLLTQDTKREARVKLAGIKSQDGKKAQRCAFFSPALDSLVVSPDLSILLPTYPGPLTISAQ
jgi:hypothetical protein